MSKKQRKFADDGWAICVDGDDVTSVYFNDWLNPKGKSYIDVAIDIRGIKESKFLNMYIPFSVSKEEIEAQYSGEPVDIALNAMYFSDVLKVIDSDDISIDFKFNEEKKVSSALIVRAAGEEKTSYTHIIMPMTF